MISVVSLEALSSSLETDIFINELRVGVRPLLSAFFEEVLLVLVHQAHEANVEVIADYEFTGNLIRDRAKIHQHGHNIRLQVVVFRIHVGILDVVSSVFDMWSKPSKSFNVCRVAHDRVPRRALDCLLGPSSVLKLFDKVLLNKLEAELLHHLLVFSDNFVGLRKKQSLKEVWQVLIDLHSINGHCETPFL